MESQSPARKSVCIHKDIFKLMRTVKSSRSSLIGVIVTWLFQDNFMVYKRDGPR